MRKFLAALMTLALLGGTAFASATDQTSDKSELLAKGDSPHVRFVDNNGDDYTLTVDGNVMRVNDLNGNAFLNVPPTGTFGVELNVPTGVTATPTAGGSLAASTTYFFVVTALDGVGETVGSTEVMCLTTVSNKTCHISWTMVSPPASSYRVYMGLSAGAEDHYDSTGGTTYNAVASPLPTPGTPPTATNAYFIRIDQNGIHFSDGSSQTTAGGSAAWQVSGTNILSAKSGNVGIGTGGVFTPDAKLTVLGSIDVDDRGWVGTVSTNDMEMRSNYRSSNNTLWNAGFSSWSVSAGNGADELSVFRAAATGGTPLYKKLMAIDIGIVSTGTNLSLNSQGLGNTDLIVGGQFSGENAAVEINGAASTTPFLHIQRNAAADKFEMLLANPASFNISWTGTNIIFTNFSTTYLEIKSTALSGETNFVLVRNNGSSSDLRTVALGAADSCGSGFRCLQVGN